MAASYPHDTYTPDPNTPAGSSPDEIAVPNDSALLLADMTAESYAFPENLLQPGTEARLQAERRPANQLPRVISAEPQSSFSLDSSPHHHVTLEHNQARAEGLDRDHDLFVNNTHVATYDFDGTGPLHSNFNEYIGSLVNVGTGAQATFPFTIPEYASVDYQAHDTYKEHFNGNVFNDVSDFKDASAFEYASAFTTGPYETSLDNATSTQVPFGSSSGHMTSQAAYQPIAPALGLNTANAPYSMGPMTPNDPRIRCTFAGCTRTFRRIGDCRRHEAKHQAPGFKCIDLECKKRFYRLDKARDHFRQGHGITL